MKIKVVFCLIAVFELIESSSIARESLEAEAAPNEDDEFLRQLMDSFELSEKFSTDPPPTTEVSDFKTSSETSVENEISSDETQSVEIQNGSFFRLKLTVQEEWTDEFLDKSSETFTNLANNLGAELIDLIDNSNESIEPNLTSFKLIEVLPSKNSKESIYVTFIVTSSVELNGENLKNVISNKTLLEGVIYEIKVSHEGFCMENISEETAKNEENADRGSNCDSDGFSESSATIHPEFIESVSQTSNEFINVVKDFRRVNKCSRETIERGKTAIYIFEDNQQCVETVRNQIDGGHNDFQDDIEMLGDEPQEENVNKECEKSSKSVKRSTNESEDEETIIVVKRKGSKIFIEM